MPNAVIYARYSTSKQREASIEDQVKECKRYADSMGFTVLRVYSDSAISGKTDQRPQFQKMIADSSEKRFEYVILYTLDRFARDRYDHAYYKRLLRENGVTVCYATQPISNGPEGIILESMLEGYSEYYSQELARKVKRGLNHNASEGLSVGCGVPFGIKVIDHRYVEDPVTGNAVRKIFEMYADGERPCDICNWLNSNGYKTSMGKAFGRTSLPNILRNRRYIGDFVYAGIKYPDQPVIVDPELFNRVQARLKIASKARAHAKAKCEFLLTTKCFCGHCGQPIIGDSGTSASGTVYYYYKCSTRKRKAGACRKQAEHKDELEKAIVLETVHRILTPEHIHEIAQKAYDIAEEEARNNTALRSMEANLKKIENSLDNIMKAIEAGIFNSTTGKRMDALEREKLELQSKIEIERAKHPPIDRDRIEYWLTSFVGGNVDSVVYRRKIINTLVNSITLFDEPDGGTRVTITFNLSKNNVHTFTCSDIGGIVPPILLNPNIFFLMIGEIFGFSFYFVK